MTVARPLQFVIAAVLIAETLVGCRGPAPSAQDRDQQGRPVEAVSSVPPNPQALQQDRDVAVVQRMKRVEGAGDCAPRYSNGELGMCINNKPCRGFGVVNDAGVVSCTCYGRAEGCAANERCEYRTASCVPEEQPRFNRARTP